MVQRVRSVREGPRSDEARLVNSPRKERLARVLAVVVEAVDADRMTTCGAATNSHGIRVATGRGYVLLNKLQEDMLIAETKIRKSFLLKYG